MRKLGMRLPNTPAVAWHSRGEENRDGLGTSVTPVEGVCNEYTRVEAPALEDCASVLLAVNHFCYSAAIFLDVSGRDSRALGVSGANWATSMAYRGVPQ